MTTLLRLIVAGSLFFLLFYFDLIDLAALTRLSDHLPGMLLALALLIATTPISSSRWHLLLRCQGFRPTLGKVVQVTFIGQFFNVFLPGSCGGDVIRLGYLYRAARTALSRLLFSLALDRLFGLLALITLGLAVMVLFETRSAPELLLYLVAFIVAVGLGTLLAALYGERLISPLRDSRLRIVRRLGRSASEIIAGLRLYIGNPRLLLTAWLLSLINISCAITAMLIIADAMEIGSLTWMENVIVATLSLIINAVPLTPGGLGLGEAGYAHLANSFDPAGSAVAYGTVFLAYRAIFVLANLPGGALFLIYRHDVMEYIHVAPATEPAEVPASGAPQALQGRRNSE
jgi:uncharacterized protein (TIRG00374 family)